MDDRKTKTSKALTGATTKGVQTMTPTIVTAALTITIPINAFTWFSFAILAGYTLCGIGNKIKSPMINFIIIVLAIIIFCLGYDPSIIAFFIRK